MPWPLSAVHKRRELLYLSFLVALYILIYTRISNNFQTLPNKLVRLDSEAINDFIEATMRTACIGPNFCTFHHICLNPSNKSTFKSERKIKPPSPRDLLATHSALTHYVQSHSLAAHTHLDPHLDHPHLIAPLIDGATGVRVKETHWLGPLGVRMSCYLVACSSRRRRGRMMELTAETDRSLMHSSRHHYGGQNSTPSRRPRAVVKAAMHITTQKFLLEVSQTL